MCRYIQSIKPELRDSTGLFIRGLNLDENKCTINEYGR
jgi:hypothetical protein